MPGRGSSDAATKQRQIETRQTETLIERKTEEQWDRDSSDQQADERRKRQSEEQSVNLYSQSLPVSLSTFALLF